MKHINTVDDKVTTKDNRMKDSFYYYQNLRNQGSKRLTIPMDKIEHLENCLCVVCELKEELEKIKKQRIPAYLRLLHTRHAIDQANYAIKLLANGGDDTVHKSYKGAV